MPSGAGACFALKQACYAAREDDMALPATPAKVQQACLVNLQDVLFSQIQLRCVVSSVYS